MKNQVVQPEGNYYDKYHSGNPIVRWMMKGFFKSIEELLEKIEAVPEKILEAGCGEGEVTSHLRNLYPQTEIDAFDISEKVITEAIEKYPNINFYVGNIYSMEVRKPKEEKMYSLSEGYSLVVCSEVLEHLEEPATALAEIKRLGTGYVLLSVPNEPIWRILNMLRGKYWKDMGNTPGHIQHWSKKGFCKLVKESGMEIVETKSPFPWTMVLARKR